MSGSNSDLKGTVGHHSGTHCDNFPDDVKLVKRLLNPYVKQIGLAHPLDVNNPYCGATTIKAIEDFQRIVMRKGPPYGRILPTRQGGTTLKALLKTATRSAPGSTLAPRVRQGMDFFVGQGWTPAQAAGIVANLAIESHELTPTDVGDGGAAYGIAQWHPDRQADFKGFTGHSIKNSTLEEQLSFVQHELTRGNWVPAGHRLRRAATAHEAGSAVSLYYERPAISIKNAALRGQLAEQLLAGYR